MPTLLPEYASPDVVDADRFFLDVDPEPTQQLTVAWGGRETCGSRYFVERAGLHLMTVEFVAAGKGELTLSGRAPVPLQAGTAFFYGPGISHTIRNDAASPMVKFFVNFVGREGKKAIAQSPLDGGQACDVSEPQELSHLFDSLLREGKHGTSQYRANICATYVNLLILKISELAINRETDASTALATFRQVKEFMNAHCERLTNVEQIAGEIDLSTSYVSRLFRRYDHITAYAYLTQLRMNRAAQLLTTTRMSVGQVARALNCSDQFHFSRAFKRQFGMPPIQFRCRSR